MVVRQMVVEKHMRRNAAAVDRRTTAAVVVDPVMVMKQGSDIVQVVERSRDQHTQPR